MLATGRPPSRRADRTGVRRERRRLKRTRDMAPSKRQSLNYWKNAGKRTIPPAMSGLKIGDVTIPGRVLIAPMTGVSYLPFRQAASLQCAPSVATEMVACDSFARGRPDVVRRAAIGT